MDDAILKQGFAAHARSLRDFGYPDVTAAMIEAAHKDWLAGNEPTDIIAMMSIRAFEDYPKIFGERASA